MIKVLIVEDEESISNLIRVSLVKAGYLCECAFEIPVIFLTTMGFLEDKVKGLKQGA